VGQTLTANTGSLDGSGAITYQWKRGTTNIGTNSGTYTVRPADEGFTITVTVTRSGYSGSAISDPTAAVTGAGLLPLTGTVSISGTAQVGQTLTANIGSLGGSGAITYQWKRGTTNIGTNSGTYTVQPADEGFTITVTVTRPGHSGSATSDPAGPVTGANQARVNAQTPNITIQPEGATVIVDASYSLSVAASVSDSGTLSYQWYSSASATNTGGTAINGATLPSYNPPTGVAGTYHYFVEVKNTISDNGDGGNKTASARSDAVEIRIPPLGVVVVNLAGMNEWELTEQTAQATANANRVFTVSGAYTAYRWYLDGTQVGTSSTYTLNEPAGVYQLVVAVTNNNGESRSGRCWVTVVPIFYTVTFDANGGSGITPATQTVVAGSSITLPSEGSLSRGSYTFGGWNTNSSGMGTNYGAGASYTPTGNVTLYATWALTPLAADAWANGSLATASGEDWYSFPVTSGITYRVWWNDSYEGNQTKSGDVVVGARYAGSGSWIFGGADNSIDSGWNMAQSFTATQTGTVEIRVILFNRSSSYTGTYGIAYSTSTARPAL
jgi:hypothetical protein